MEKIPVYIITDDWNAIQKVTRDRNEAIKEAISILKSQFDEEELYGMMEADKVSTLEAFVALNLDLSDTYTIHTYFV